MFMGIDQYGQHHHAIPNLKYSTLRDRFCCGSIRKLYADVQDGNEQQTKHVGYVLGQGRGNASLWVTFYNVTPIN